MTLWKEYFENSDVERRKFDKWSHYFPIYDRHFSRYQNTSVIFWEIGVQKGGSCQMWNRYFGPNARIIGIDIDPSYADNVDPGVEIRIGNQSDTNFLQSIIDEFGYPDIVLDDGSHMMADVTATFDFMYNKISRNGVYMIEDMHTCYWPHYGGGVSNPDSFLNISKKHIDQLTAHWSQGKVIPDWITDNTQSISYYDSVIVYERGQQLKRRSVWTD
jgi:23S rRNA U2552 (ribose-2'-O)-methylase RlmE/FtsJ